MSLFIHIACASSNATACPHPFFNFTVNAPFSKLFMISFGAGRCLQDVVESVSDSMGDRALKKEVPCTLG